MSVSNIQSAKNYKEHQRQNRQQAAHEDRMKRLGRTVGVGLGLVAAAGIVFAATRGGGHKNAEDVIRHGGIHDGKLTISAGEMLYNSPTEKDQPDGSSGKDDVPNGTPLAEGTVIELQKPTIVTGFDSKKYAVVYVPKSGVPGEVNVPHNIHKLSLVAKYVEFTPQIGDTVSSYPTEFIDSKSESIPANDMHETIRLTN